MIIVWQLMYGEDYNANILAEVRSVYDPISIQDLRGVGILEQVNKTREIQKSKDNVIIITENVALMEYADIGYLSNRRVKER